MRKLRFGVVLILILAGIAAAQTLFIIDERQQSIITQFGDYIRTVEEPGLHFKTPFVQTVHRLEKRVLASDSDSQEYLTRDKKRIIMNHVIRWRIVDPYNFYRSVRTEIQGRDRLNAIISGRLREEVARHNFAELIREEREAIMETVTAESRPLAERIGMEIIDVRVKRADLPPEVQESVFARMEAERNRIASRYRAEGEERAQEIRASANREREIIQAEAVQKSQILRGDGDAQATAIFAEAFQRDPEFYAFLRSLEAYEKFLPSDSTLILGIEAELFRYLRSKSGS